MNQYCSTCGKKEVASTSTHQGTMFYCPEKHTWYLCQRHRVITLTKRECCAVCVLEKRLLDIPAEVAAVVTGFLEGHFEEARGDKVRTHKDEM